MPGNSLILGLVQEVLESDRTPENVCVDHPELLWEVREQLKQVECFEARLTEVFPSSIDGRVIRKPQSLPSGDLPDVPGYKLEDVIGCGGMGVVFRARHLKLNRLIALKMLLSGAFAGREEKARFIREAEAIAGLSHPHIVQVHDVGELERRPYYTMELLEGGSLAQRLAGSPQPARQSAQLIATLAAAVAYAHERGIVHRDLKPGNILMTADDTPKIVDFGLARRLDATQDLTISGARLGTPSYMAPEQATGKKSAVGPATDVYALGAVLYQMLTGRPPFRADTAAETERQVIAEEPARPSRLNASIPRDLETICLKCLEKEPGNRYRSANDLAADLKRFLRCEPIHARAVAPVERWMRWVRRNLLLTALLVTSAVLLGVIGREAMREWTLASAARSEKARLTERFDSGVELVQAGRLAEGRAILGKLGDGGFDDLRQRIDRVLSDLNLVEMTEAIGVERAIALNAEEVQWLPNVQAATAYEALFARAGIGKMPDAPLLVASHIGASDIKEPLIAAFDDWAVCETDEARRKWVLEVARNAGAAVGEWEKQCRDPATWSDRDVLIRLAETAPCAQPSVQQLRALGDRLAAAGLDGADFRYRVQHHHPDSFLANLSLADALKETDPAESIRYYQAALAIRPQSATAHNNLGVALANLGRSNEAIVQYEQSLKLDPQSATTQYNLAVELSRQRPVEAIQHLHKAIGLNEKLAAARDLLEELFREAPL